MSWVRCRPEHGVAESQLLNPRVARCRVVAKRGTPPWCWLASLSWLFPPVAAALRSRGWQTERLPSRPRPPHNPRSPGCSPSPKRGRKPWSRPFPKRGRKPNQCQGRPLRSPHRFWMPRSSVRKRSSGPTAKRLRPVSCRLPLNWRASRMCPAKCWPQGPESPRKMTKSRCGPSSFLLPDRRRYRRLRTRG